jgi:hypothetical protein
VLFIPSCPGYTGLTGALDRSDRCESLVGFASGELLDSCVFGSWSCWSVLGRFGVGLFRFCVGFSFRTGSVFGVFLFQGLEKSLWLPGPLWFAVSVLQVVPEPVEIFIDSNQSKIQGWRTRNGVRVRHTSMARITRCGVSGWWRFSAERVRSFGMSLWTRAMSSR